MSLRSKVVPVFLDEMVGQGRYRSLCISMTVIPSQKKQSPILPAFARHHGSGIPAMRAHEVIDKRKQHDAAEDDNRVVHLGNRC